MWARSSGADRTRTGRGSGRTELASKHAGQEGRPFLAGKHQRAAARVLGIPYPAPAIRQLSELDTVAIVRAPGTLAPRRPLQVHLKDTVRPSSVRPRRCDPPLAPLRTDQSNLASIERCPWAPWHLTDLGFLTWGHRPGKRHPAVRQSPSGRRSRHSRANDQAGQRPPSRFAAITLLAMAREHCRIRAANLTWGNAQVRTAEERGARVPAAGGPSLLAPPRPTRRGCAAH